MPHLRPYSRGPWRRPSYLTDTALGDLRRVSLAALAFGSVPALWLRPYPATFATSRSAPGTRLLDSRAWISWRSFPRPVTLLPVGFAPARVSGAAERCPNRVRSDRHRRRAGIAPEAAGYSTQKHNTPRKGREVSRICLDSRVGVHLAFTNGHGSLVVAPLV